MKKIEIYDPAMCCSTGICGHSVDPELIRISAVIHNLKNKGFNVSRFNLSSEPNAFVTNQTINRLLAEKGPNILPVVIVDGQAVKEQSYPSNEEFCKWTGLNEAELIAKPRMRLELNVKQK